MSPEEEADRKMMHDMLWKSILEHIETITKAYPNEQQSYRGTSMTSQDGNTMSCVLKLSRGNGASSVYYIIASRRLNFRRGAEPEILVRHERWVDHSEEFWNEQIRTDRESAVVVDGVHYRLGKNAGPKDMRGMGGREFLIKNIATDEVSWTDDLWYQGPIPHIFRDRLPDTHVFVNRGK